MWIFCCGMMRSGSTLQYQIAAHLVEEFGLGQRIEWVKPDEFPALRKKYADVPGLKVYKTHMYTEEMAAEFVSGNAKGLYIYRDLRDVIVSFMVKRPSPFRFAWVRQSLDQQLINYQQWTNHVEVQVSCYEDVMASLATEVLRIATHLGIDVDRAYCDHVADLYSIKQQRKRIEHAKEEGRLELVSGKHYLDSQTLLHSNHINSGEINQWQKVLSSADIALIEKFAGDWLLKHDYTLYTSLLKRHFYFTAYRIRYRYHSIMGK